MSEELKYDNHPGDGEWDYYSGLPNPKWYERTTSWTQEEED